MDTPEKLPETLIEAIKFFANADITHDFVVALRWPMGVRCIYCDSDKVGFIESRKRFQCKNCRKQFSVRHETIFEDSHVGLDKWMCAFWMIANCRNGVSSYEIHRDLGVTQKTAWFMLHRIRLAMQSGTFEKLSGNVEVDETLIGGKARFMHADRREKFGKQKTGKKTGSFGKTVVMGVLERGKEVRAEVVQNSGRKQLDPRVRKHVEAGSTLYTDALPSYESLRDEYIHKTVDHAETYVKGDIHTNGLENFWSLLKRGIKGTYVSVEPFHLFRYLDEQVYRYNNRELTDLQRFLGALRGVFGKRLMYTQLTGQPTV